MNEEYIVYLVTYYCKKDEEIELQRFYKTQIAYHEKDANEYILNDLNSQGDFIGIFCDEEEALENDMDAYVIIRKDIILEVSIASPEVYLLKDANQNKEKKD